MGGGTLNETVGSPSDAEGRPIANAGADADQRRVIRPRPGGRGGAAAAPAPAAREEPAPVEPGAGLIGPAMPLLQLMARLRTVTSRPDPGELRERVEAEVQRFETRALAAGVAADLVRRGHYALCASMDEIAANTPWGARGAWVPLVGQFHPSVGGERFFDMLRQVQEKVGAFRPVLELMYVCVSLGVMGPYRTAADGAAAVERLRAAAAAALAGSAPAAPVPLAAQWQGVAAPYRPRRNRFPIWVAASAGAAAVAGLFVLLSARLNDQGDGLFARMLAAAPSQMPVVTRQALATPPPPAPPPAEPSAADRVRQRLAQAGVGQVVVVAGTPTTPVLRIQERALFAGNGAVPGAGAGKLMDAVWAAVKPEGGRLQVVGYLDDRPVRTVLFPSAFQLTAARARAVRELLVKGGAEAGRVAAEGRAAASPVAANATAEGREQNRRVEIVLDGVAG